MRGKSSILAALAILAASVPVHNPVREDRFWVDELQPGRKRTRSNNEAQWKREQRGGKKARK